MKNVRLKLSLNLLLCLFSVFLIGAGISRYLETDSGNILIHDIDMENYEGFIYKGRLFRPLQASSMNLRPGILMVFGDASDRYTGDHIAMELARRGFVTLTIEDFSHGMTDPAPEEATENLIDAGYTFLSTRTFTDHDRIGLVTFYAGADKTMSVKYLPEFTTRIYVSPKAGSTAELSDSDRIFSSDFETSPLYRSDEKAPGKVKLFKASHAGMIFHASVIAAISEHFHNTMPIPNDSPFWFDPAAQRAQLLLILRFLLLILLITICCGICALINSKAAHHRLRNFLSILLPLLFLLVVEEFMNFFMISVRLGTPFNYLPRVIQLSRIFSPVTCILMVLCSIISSTAIGKNKKWMFSDLLAAIGAALCLCGFLPILFGNRSGWELSGISGYRYLVCLVAFLALLNSFLLRLTGKNKLARHCSAVLNGLIFYWMCSNLPLNILIQE